MDRYDLLLLVGLACIEGGVALWSTPAALILGGVLLVIASCAADLRARLRRTMNGAPDGTDR